MIHFAGLKAVGESVSKPLEYYDNNVGGTVTLCRVMAEAGCKRIVFSSSATVYGMNNPSPLKEDMPTGAVTNPYGRTKYIIEEILKDVCVSDPAWTAVLLRYFNPIGAHESGRIGEDPNGIPNNLMPYISQVAIGQAAAARHPWRRLRHPRRHRGAGLHPRGGSGGRVISKAVDYAMTHTGAEAFNLGTGRGYSVLDLVKAFESANGVPVPHVIGAPPGGGYRHLLFRPLQSGAGVGLEGETGRGG